MPTKLLTRLREAIRVRGFSMSTERAYVSWVIRYIRFHGMRHPDQLDETDITAFLTHLAVNRDVAANIQNQALCVRKSHRSCRWYWAAMRCAQC